MKPKTQISHVLLPHDIYDVTAKTVCGIPVQIVGIRRGGLVRKCKRCSKVRKGEK